MHEIILVLGVIVISYVYSFNKTVVKYDMEFSVFDAGIYTLVQYL